MKHLTDIITKKRAIITGVIFLAVILVLSILPLAVSATRVPWKTSVGTVKVGLIDYQDAEKKLKKAYSEYINSQKVNILIGESTTRTLLKDIGVSFDAENTVSQIKDSTLEKSFFRRWLSTFKLFYYPTRLPVKLKIDNAEFSSFLAGLNNAYGTKPTNAVLDVSEDGKYKVEKSKDGKSIKQEEFIEKIKTAIENFDSTVSAELTVEEPRISTEDVKKLVNEFPEWKKKKLTVYRSGNKYSITGDRLISLLKAGYKDDKVRLEIDPIDLAPLLNDRFMEYTIQPVDAHFKVVDGKIEVVPGKEGLQIDSTYTAETASDLLQKQKIAEVKIRLTEKEPELIYREAKSMGIKEEISSFTTHYNPYQTPRVTNIKVLAELLDGMLIAPGETFSFNEKLGPRTQERGFKLAPTIINGRLVDTAGGGTCQVSTTLFNTVFFAGLEIVYRRNHSFYISHYPDGRDATVSYGSVDFKFKNDYKSWILIKANATSGKITITFYGTDEGRKVEYWTSEAYNFKPFKKDYIKDPEIEKGKQIVESEGIRGRTIVVERKVNSKNGKLIHDDKFVSIYRPKVEIIRVGTKEVKETTETTVSPQQ